MLGLYFSYKFQFLSFFIKSKREIEEMEENSSQNSQLNEKNCDSKSFSNNLYSSEIKKEKLLNKNTTFDNYFEALVKSSIQKLNSQRSKVNFIKPKKNDANIKEIFENDEIKREDKFDNDMNQDNSINKMSDSGIKFTRCK